MSLKTVHPLQIIKKQYDFKLRANIDSLSSLVGIQLLGIIFSLWGVATSGSFSENISISAKYYSADLVIAFTMIWGFTTAITITTKPHRYQDFIFVTNRLTSNVANICFLVTASVIGGVTAILSKRLLILVATFFFDLVLYGTPFLFKQFLLGIIATILYILFASALGYLIGVLVQVSRLFVFIIPALFVGSLFLSEALQRDPIVMEMMQFYFLESSFFLFLIKTVLTAVLLFIASIMILNRMEVKK